MGISGSVSRPKYQSLRFYCPRRVKGMAMNMCKERGQKWCPYIRPGYFGRTAFLKKIFIFIYFLEKGEGREKERERNIDVQEIH